jgi:hypothetical protein
MISAIKTTYKEILLKLFIYGLDFEMWHQNKINTAYIVKDMWDAF